MATLIGLLAIVSVASAQDARSSAMARRLFREGVQLAEDGQHEQAVERFRRAAGLRAAPAISYNMAQSLVSLGRYVEAVEALRSVQREVPSGDVREMADELLESVEPRICNLTVSLDGDPAGVEIKIDGELLVAEAIGIEAPIDPGSHLLEAIRDGTPVASETVEVAEGGSQEVTLVIPQVVEASDVTLPPAEDPTTSPLDGSAPDDSSGGIASRWWFWTLIGVVVVGAGVGIALALTSGTESPIQGNAMPGVVTWD